MELEEKISVVHGVRRGECNECECSGYRGDKGPCSLCGHLANQHRFLGISAEGLNQILSRNEIIYIFIFKMWQKKHNRKKMHFLSLELLEHHLKKKIKNYLPIYLFGNKQ